MLRSGLPRARGSDARRPTRAGLGAPGSIGDGTKSTRPAPPGAGIGWQLSQQTGSPARQHQVLSAAPVAPLAMAIGWGLSPEAG